MTLSYRLGVDKLYEWAAALGLTSKTNIELPGESTSFVGNQEHAVRSGTLAIEDQYTSKPRLTARMPSATSWLTRSAKSATLNTAMSCMDKVVLQAAEDRRELRQEGRMGTAHPRDPAIRSGSAPSTTSRNNYLVNTFTTYLQDIFVDAERDHHGRHRPVHHAG